MTMLSFGDFLQKEGRVVGNFLKSLQEVARSKGAIPWRVLDPKKRGQVSKARFVERCTLLSLTSCPVRMFNALDLTGKCRLHADDLDVYLSTWPSDHADIPSTEDGALEATRDEPE